MVQWNISPEAYRGKNPVNPKDEWVRTASGAFFASDNEQPILKTIVKDLYDKRRKTKDKMLELEYEIDQLQKKIGKTKK
jgi:DNA polymerase elongation subunit (family B)